MFGLIAHLLNKKFQNGYFRELFIDVAGFCSLAL